MQLGLTRIDNGRSGASICGMTTDTPATAEQIAAIKRTASDRTQHILLLAEKLVHEKDGLDVCVRTAAAHELRQLVEK